MDSSWNAMKNFLKDRTILDQILDFDPRRISPEMRSDCEAEISQNPSYF